MSDELPILTKAAGGCYLGKYDLHQLTSVELQRLLDNAAAVSAAENARLRAELAKHQESEFHPDWSMLVATRESLAEHQQMIVALREQLTLAESVRAAQVAGLTEGAEKLRGRVKALEDALTHISLCSQSSMSSKEECGRIARAALKGASHE